MSQTSQIGLLAGFRPVLLCIYCYNVYWYFELAFIFIFSVYIFILVLVILSGVFVN